VAHAALLLGILLLSAPLLVGRGWQPNEFDYFGQAAHFGVTSPQAAVYASSKPELFRGLYAALTRTAIDAWGFEGALVIERLLAWVGLGGALWALITRWDFKPVAAMLALAAFLLRQAYFGGEWLFGGAEAKVFAYVAVLAALAAWRSQSWRTAGWCLVVASYLHFLVGMFWAMALFCLMAMDAPTRVALRRMALRYGLAMIPLLFLILLQERSMLSTGEVQPGALTLNQIYSNVRNPHHVAPFLHGVYNWDRLGVLWFVAGWMALGWICKTSMRYRTVATWLLGLHAYLLLAFVVAWFDRDAQLFGKFYLFRPAALIWLLTLLLTAQALQEWIAPIETSAWHRVLMVGACALVVSAGTRSVSGPHLGLSLMNSLTKDEQSMVTWVRDHTASGTVVLMEEPLLRTHLNAMNVEQLTGRPSLVNWKFVPTTSEALSRWYQLNLLKQSAFAGHCEAARQLPVNLVLTHTAAAGEAWRACGAHQVQQVGDWQAWSWGPPA